MADQPNVILGFQPDRSIDLLLVNAPLRDYEARPRTNDFTLPVLGLAYIATYAESQGFNVGVLDAEASGMTIADVVDAVNAARPAWVGFNLLAPTYEMSARVASGLDADIKLLLGGHQARALPERILRDPRMARCEALVIGEAETRVVELLRDMDSRGGLPQVYWLEDERIAAGKPATPRPELLAPDIDELPFVDRKFLATDPTLANGRWKSSMVGARGCPYNCSFCGAAASANPDVTIRVRSAANIIREMTQLRSELGVETFRFVDDLFLGAKRVITEMSTKFVEAGVGEWASWDATGRINVLDRLDDEQLELLRKAGLSEVAVGVESGSVRVLEMIDKRIDPAMVKRVVKRLVDVGVDVKGYFIFGFPSETELEISETLRLVKDLWATADQGSGSFRASAFEYRPYPGTPDWNRLLETGEYTIEELLDYQPVDLTDGGGTDFMRERDEFNFAIPTDLAAAPRHVVRSAVSRVAQRQHERMSRAVGA